MTPFDPFTHIKLKTCLWDRGHYTGISIPQASAVGRWSWQRWRRDLHSASGRRGWCSGNGGSRWCADTERQSWWRVSPTIRRHPLINRWLILTWDASILCICRRCRGPRRVDSQVGFIKHNPSSDADIGVGRICISTIIKSSYLSQQRCGFLQGVLQVNNKITTSKQTKKKCIYC